MNSLIIDCSAGMKLYLIGHDKEYVKIDENQKKHTDELLVEIDKLLKDADLKIDDIDNLCVCVGPGSFTGIRVAISICKGLAVDSKMKIFVASNFEIFEDKLENNSIYVLEGFSKYIYVKTNCNGLIKEECVDINQFIARDNLSEFKIYVSNEKVQKILEMNKIISHIAQNNTISAFLEKIKQNKNIKLNQIQPLYLRASQAEIERNVMISKGNNE